MGYNTTVEYCEFTNNNALNGSYWFEPNLQEGILLDGITEITYKGNNPLETDNFDKIGYNWGGTLAKMLHSQ